MSETHRIYRDPRREPETTWSWSGRRLRSRTILVLLTACLIGVRTDRADAQSVFSETGFASARDTYTVLPYEHVDPLSGNLIVAATDLVLPGNAGLDLRVVRVYNSKFHRDYEHGDAGIDEWSWAGAGWRLHFGRVLHADSQTPGETIVETPDGGTEPLYRSLTYPESWMTKSFARYDRGAHTLKLPNGLIYTFGHIGASGGDRGTVRYVTEIRDPFGNRLTFTYFDAPGPTEGVKQIRQILSDTETRIVDFTYAAGTNALATMMYDGRTWTYEQEPSGVAGQQVLRRVRPPAGLPWEFQYTTSAAGPELTAMLVPGGGRIEYAYGDVVRPQGASNLPSRVVTERRIAGWRITPGTWTFSYSQGANRDESVVASPCGTTRYRYYGIGLADPPNAWRTGALAERTLEEAGVVLERELLTWERSELIAPDPVSGSDGSDPGVYNTLLSERVITRGPQSWKTSYEYRSGQGTFNDYGQAWRTVEDGELDRITERTFASGFTPHIVGRVATQMVKVGAEQITSAWTYDLGTGFLTEANAFGIITKFEPRADGNMAAVVNGNNHRVTFKYQWAGVRETRTDYVKTEAVINPDGTVASTTLENLTTTYGYDAVGRIRVVRPPNTHVINYEYDGLNNEFVRIARHNAQTQHDLDGFGRVVFSSDFTNVRTRIERDACGRAVFASAPYTTGDGSRGTRTLYDALGRIKTVTAADNSQTHYAYTGIDITMTDAEQRVTTHDYSAYGAPGAAHLMRLTDADQQVTTYTYEVFGNLATATGPGIAPARTWVYNGKGQLWKETHPESGTTTYTYDAAGNLKTSTDAKGQQIVLSYDGIERLIGRDATGTDADLTLTYDALRRIETQTVAGVQTGFGYDNAGRLAWRCDGFTGASTFCTNFTYDRSDNLEYVVYEQRRWVKYEYDNSNRLLRVLNNNVPFATDFRYDESGRLMSYATGAVTHTVTYDDRDRVKRLTAGPATGAALDLTYGYNRVSHVKSIIDARPGLSQAFDYDAVDRLKSANGPWGQLSWTYDAMGNRRTEVRGSTTVYHYDTATNRLHSTSGAVAESLGYDAIGQLTSDNRGTYTYSPAGAMLTASRPGLSASYLYDASSLRVKRQVNDATYFTIRSPGGQTLSEYETQCGTLTWVRDNVYVGSRLIGAVRASQAVPTVAFVAPSSTVGEANGSVAPSVRLVTATGQPLACPVTVTFDTRPGQALAGWDYTATTGSLVFAAGTASGTERAIAPAVPITNDATDESDEGFTIQLTGATGAGLGAQAAHVAVLQDDDAPPALAIGDVTVNEGAGTATFPVTLSAASAFEIRVSYATADGSAVAGADYAAQSGTLVLPPLALSGTITVPILENTKVEPTETFLVTLTAPVNVTLADAQAVGTILDNERPRAPIDLSLYGAFLADLTAEAGKLDYLLIANPHEAPLTARLTFTRADGSGTSRDVTLAGRARLNLLLQNEPGYVGEVGLSAAVQSLDPTRPVVVEHSAYWNSWQAGRSSEGHHPHWQWIFAEGSTSYFDETITVFNPNPHPIDVWFGFYGAHGALTGHLIRIEEGPGRAQLRVDDLLPSGDHATIVRGYVNGTPAPIVAERTMTWQGDQREGHSSAGVANPSPTWYLAEGTTGFATYLALFNSNDTATTVRVAYLHENGTVYDTDVAVGAWARTTVAPPAWLPAGNFAYRIVTFDGKSITVERAMYWGADWSVGHAGTPVSQPASVWVFPEGTTGGPFDTYFLLANPSTTTAASVTFNFFRAADGAGLQSHVVSIPAGRRVTVAADALANLSAAEFTTIVSSTSPIVAERVTYWSAQGMTASLWALMNPGFVAQPTNAAPTTVDTAAVTASPVAYTDVVTGEPVGGASTAAAAAYARGDAVATPASSSPAPLLVGPWIGAHLTGGRSPW